MDIPILIFPPEMKVGETLKNYYQTKTGNEEWPFNITLAGLETVTVPAGAFNSLRVEIVIQDNDCSYKTTFWFAKDIGPVKIQRTEANPQDCIGCMFICDPNNDVVKLNTPAELTSAIIDGTTY